MSRGNGQSERTLRVFVSSTFRDMGEEREELVKRVFPRIRRMCEARSVAFADVDLRWGITDEQAARGEVLPICLAEIERCRPYFIGVLGDRYGYVPPAVPQELLQEEPWLSELGGRSVTELEIVHGVLRDPSMPAHAFFYFREEQARVGSGEPESAQQRLADLKARVRTAPVRLREGYRTAEELGGWVLEDLSELVGRLFPQGDVPDWQTLVEQRHESHLRARARDHVGCADELTYLDRLASDGGCVLFTGPPGIGKTALLASWVERLRDTAPESLCVITHAVGAMPEATDVDAAMIRILTQLRRELGLREELPEDRAEYRHVLSRWLAIAARRGRVVLVVDDVDRFDDLHGAPDLLWLPRAIPDGVTVVISARPGRTTDAARARGIEVRELGPLTEGERRGLIRGFLGRFRKSLAEDRVELLARTPACGLPLFLRAILEEIRVYGSHEGLESRIRHYLTAESLGQLYDRILDRLAGDYERHRPGLVMDTCRLVVASHGGLEEPELRDLLVTDDELLPMAVWAPFVLASSAILETQGGCLRIVNGSARAAIQRRLGDGQQADRDTTEQLAAYFGRRGACRRAAQELPPALLHLEAWNRLAAALSDPDFLAVAWSTGLERHLLRYWERIELASDERAPARYAETIACPTADLDRARRVGLLLYGLQYLADARAIYDELAVADERQARYQEACEALLTVGWIYALEGNLTLACERFEACMRLAVDLEDPAPLARAIGQSAILFQQLHEFERSDVLYREATELLQRSASQGDLGRCLNQHGILREAMGDVTGALQLYEGAERAFEEAGEVGGVARALDHQGIACWKLGDMARSGALWERAGNLFLRTDDDEGLALFLANIGGLKALGQDPDLAAPYLIQAESILRARLPSDTLARVLCHRVLARARGGVFEGQALQEAIDIRRDLGNRGAMISAIELLEKFVPADAAQVRRALGDARVRLEKEIAEGPTRSAARPGRRHTDRFRPTEDYGAAARRSDEDWETQIRRAEELGAEALLGELSLRALVLQGEGRATQADGLLERVMCVAREAGDAARAFDACTHRIRGAVLVGDTRRSLDLFLEQEALAADFEDVELMLAAQAAQGERVGDLPRGSEERRELQARIDGGPQRALALVRSIAEPERRRAAEDVLVAAGLAGGLLRLRWKLARYLRR